MVRQEDTLIEPIRYNKQLKLYANFSYFNMENMMKKTYGINLKEKQDKQHPVKMPSSDKEGTRVVLNAARRVISKHAKVIKALAKR